MTDPQRNAEEAARILESPLVRRAFQELESNIVARLATPMLTPEQIIATQHELVAHRRIERWFRQLVVTGQMDAIVAEQKQRATTKRKLL